MENQDNMFEDLLTQNKNTKDLFYHNGQYTVDRQELHEKIINELLNNIQAPDTQPAVIFLGGGSASGKTSISRMLVESFKENQEDVLHVDSDKIKTMLPEYSRLIERDTENMAIRLHDESSDVATLLFKEGLKRNVNVILDGTMKDTNKYEKFIETAKELNYNVSAVIADVPLKEALRRADVRFEIENRRVPEDIIRLSHQKVPITFKKIEPTLDSFYLYDTSNQHPQQFYVKYNDRILVKNEQRLAQFYKKADLQVEKTPFNQINVGSKIIGKIIKSKLPGAIKGVDRDYER